MKLWSGKQYRCAMLMLLDWHDEIVAARSVSVVVVVVFATAT